MRYDVSTAHYKHDCAECIFLGFEYDLSARRVYDLYAHKRDGEPYYGYRSLELIARYSDEGPDYLATTVTAESRIGVPALNLAHARYTLMLLDLLEAR